MQTTDSGEFSRFLNQLKHQLKHIFRFNGSAASAQSLQAVTGESPLSVFIPERFGGRGQHVHECLAMLETCSYESLPLSLVAGINGALFLQPVSKFAGEELQRKTFEQFLHHRALGGLMITEPDFGSDALNMRTSFEQEGDGYRLRGTKHWGGLSGHADYWLLTARGSNERGDLERNISFFVWDKSLGGMEVEEYYQSLGLEMIPYGRNQIDTLLPGDRRFEAQGSGVRMLLDLLHRSRLQFPGMALGFLRRLLDEANTHARNRFVGGRALATYDQVQDRLVEIQTAYTACSAMCSYSTSVAGVENDCSVYALPANSIKSVVTDMMQSAAQSLLQLVGAAGYRRDHIAGAAVVDSRPFQIFEGSNDILYEQISDFMIKGMKRIKETRLSTFLAGHEGTNRAADFLRGLFDFSIDENVSQRKKVVLGRIVGRVMSMQMILDLGDRGFRKDLIDNALAIMKREINSLTGSFAASTKASMVDEYREGSSWLNFLPE